MKKFLSLLFSLILAISVCGCEAVDDEKTDETNGEVNGEGSDNDSKVESTKTFEEFLSENQNYSVTELNNAFSQIDFDIDSANLPLDEIVITDSKASIDYSYEGVEEEYEVYLWQDKDSEKNDLYVGTYVTDMDNDVTEPASVKFDVNAIREIFSEILELGKEQANDMIDNNLYPMLDEMEDYDNSGKIEMSEIIDNLLEQKGVDIDEINVASVLEKIKISESDFENKSEGVYKLKPQTLGRIYEDISRIDLEMSTEDWQEYDKIFNVSLAYDNGHINKVMVNLLTEYDYNLYDSYYVDDELVDINVGDCLKRRDVELEINLTYGSDDKVSGIAITVEMVQIIKEIYDDPIYGENSESTYRVVYSLALSENELSYTAKMGDSLILLKNKVAFSIRRNNANTELKLDVTSNNKKVIDADLTLIGNWLSEGSIKYGNSQVETIPVINITLESSVNVDIPDKIKQADPIDRTSNVLDFIDEAFNKYIVGD